MSKSVRGAREEQQALEALHRLDEECVHHQRANDYLRAFDCMERALVLRRHFFGLESEEVALACRALAEMCNLLAMSFLQQDNFPVAVDLLKKAEVLTAQHGHRFAAERATTLNNLACYYRRLGKLHAAMTSLRSAVAIERRLGRVGNAADTLLNLCAVLSQLGKHDQALTHAQEALVALQEDVFKPSAGPPPLDRVSVMCIAYHNIGVEQEFLKAYDECVQSYKKGVGLAEQYLGPEHSVTTTIRNSYLAAKRSLSAKSRGIRHQRAEDPYATSPSKGARRLLSSPRGGGSGPSSPSSLLRMPSPLTKEKQRQNMAEIPTPRSIVADALSRRALPPLDSPTGRDPGSKAGGKAVVATPLTPTDPFFSPRYRFPGNEAHVETESAASTSPDKSKRVGSASKRRANSKKRESVDVMFAKKETRGERGETQAEVDAERGQDLDPVREQEPPGEHVDAAAVPPTEEVTKAVVSVAGESETITVDEGVSRDGFAITDDGVETVGSADKPKVASTPAHAADTSTLPDDDERRVEGVEQAEVTSVPSQITAIEDTVPGPLDAAIEKPGASAEGLQDGAEGGPEASQPQEAEVEPVTDTCEVVADQAAGGGGIGLSGNLDQPDQGGLDGSAEEADSIADEETAPDTAIEAIDPAHEAIESVQDESTGFSFPNDPDNEAVVDVEAMGATAMETSTLVTSSIDPEVQGHDSEAMMVETVESESQPVLEDQGAFDQSEESVEDVPALAEATGDDVPVEDHKECADGVTEEQPTDEWLMDQGDGVSADTTDPGAFPDEVAGYDGAEDASQTYTDAVADSDGAHHYEYSGEQYIGEVNAKQTHYEEYGGDDAGLAFAEPSSSEVHQDWEADHQPQYEDATVLAEPPYEPVALEPTDEGVEQTTVDADASVTLDSIDQEHHEGGQEGGEPPPSTGES